MKRHWWKYKVWANFLLASLGRLPTRVSWYSRRACHIIWKKKTEYSQYRNTSRILRSAKILVSYYTFDAWVEDERLKNITYLHVKGHVPCHMWNIFVCTGICVDKFIPEHVFLFFNEITPKKLFLLIDHILVTKLLIQK